MTGIVDTVDVSVEVWGGLVTNLAPADLPHGVSPDCSDVQFQIGSVKTRPGITALYTLPGNPTIQYLKTYENLQEVPRLLSLDSLGILRKDTTPGGPLTTIYSGMIPGSFCRSDSLFAREYLAFSNGTNGLDIPRQYDDTYFDRLSQCGPGAAPTVVDSGTSGNISAGDHMLTVIFVTRSGFYTRPAPPVTWTAGGGKMAAVTDIPIGPPNVVARVLSFTAVAQASFYHLGPLGLTLPSSNMYIADNVTTSLTVDFTDQVILLGTLDDPLFTQIELPPVAGTISYSSRLFHWGEQGNLQNFLNITFDGGFSGQTGTPANSGFQSPSAATGGGSGYGVWQTPGNVFAADNVFSDVQVLNEIETQALVAHGYGFAIPANATITGIVVKVLAKATGTTHIADSDVYLTKNGSFSNIGTNHNDLIRLTTGSTYHTYGSSNDLWGRTWTPAEINDPGFGLSYRVNDYAGVAGDSGTAFVDYIPINVYYTTPSAAATLPNGWTPGASNVGGASANGGAFPVVFGDAYSITGDGATEIRGKITQSAAVDYLGNPIILPGVAYGVKARVASANGLLQGMIHVNLQSTSDAFTTGGLAVQASQAGATYAAFSGVLVSALIGPIPADLLLQVYADGTPTNGGVFLIDNIEIYPLNQQFNNSNVRGSTGQLATQGQESYDEVTGLMQYNLNDGQSVRNMFKIRERLYIVKEHSFGVTEDPGNAQEPALWEIDDVSKAVGTPSIQGVGTGEDWAVIAHRTGLYLFWGGEVVKVMEEIQPTWDTINWQYGYTLSVTVDTKRRRILVSAPFGESTVPNSTLVLDYHDVGSDAEALASNPPIHLTYTGRKTAFDRARKWCPWTISANTVAKIELGNLNSAVMVGSNDGTGNINVLDDTGTVLTDNGATIPSYYTTAAFAEQPTEDAKQLKSHRHLYTYLTMYVQGSGTLGITVFPASLSNAVSLNPQMLSIPAFQDSQMTLNQSTERMFLKVASQGNGEWFDLQRMVVNMKPEPWSIIR